MLANAGHGSIPMARRNAAEAAALVSHHREPAMLRFGDHEWICAVPASAVGEPRVYGAHPALNRLDRVHEDMRRLLLAPRGDLVVFGHQLQVDRAWGNDAAVGPLRWRRDPRRLGTSPAGNGPGVRSDRRLCRRRARSSSTPELVSEPLKVVDLYAREKR